MSAENDLADVAKVLGGDRAAFEGIVRRWQGPLINLAYRFFGDRGRAEDMAQEAFLRAYRGLASWRKDAAFSTWLFALATNLYRTELRRIPRRVQPFDDASEVRDPSPIDGGLEARSREAAVRNAVDALPPKYRDAITLFHFHELDLHAAAKSLALPEGTVKARLFRGRQMLRDKLSRLFPEAA